MLSLNAYPDATAFLERVQPLLEQRESVNNLILGLADTLIRYPAIYKEFMLLSVDEGETLRGVALRTIPMNVQLYVPDAAPDVIDLIARHVYEQDPTLPGAMGLIETARVFADAWTRLTGGEWQSHMRMTVYELRQVTPPTGIPGTFVTATADDLPRLTRWVRAFHKESLHDELTAEGAAQNAVRYLNRDALFLWLVDGQPVAMAGQNRQSRHGAVVGLVYTPPEQRGHGYASALVAELSQRILDRGKDFAALFADAEYAVANHIYQKMGYRAVGNFDEVTFEPPSMD
jgi:predicted GNAT family acetyltransferase